MSTTTHHDRQATAAGSRHTDHTPATVAGPPAEGAPPVEEELVKEDLLVEDVSIDGMCGVY